MKVPAIILVAVAFYLGLANGEKLQCLLCEQTDEVCNNLTTICDDDSFTCYAAKVLLDGKVRYKKGCIEKSFCTSIEDLCPGRGGSECLGAGCCHTTRCNATITLIPKSSPTNQPPTNQPPTNQTTTCSSKQAVLKAPSPLAIFLVVVGLLYYSPGY